MFRTLGAQIDTASGRIFLPGVNLDMDLTLTEIKLYLLDFGKLVNSSLKSGISDKATGESQVDNVMMAETTLSSSHEASEPS